MPRYFRTGIARKSRVEKERCRGNDCDAEESRPEIGGDDRVVALQEARDLQRVGADRDRARHTIARHSRPRFKGEL